MQEVFDSSVAALGERRGQSSRVSSDVEPSSAPKSGPSAEPPASSGSGEAQTAGRSSEDRPSSESSRGDLARVDRAIFEKWIGAACDHAESRREWYDRRAIAMGKWSRGLRFSAVTLAVLGGLCPLLPEKLIDRIPYDLGQTVPQAGFVLFALAAGAVVLDQAFGYSSSWMRSRLAELELGRLIRSNRIEFDAVMGTLATSVSKDEADGVKSRVAKFVEDVENVVVLETQTWISEFKVGLLQIERIARTSDKMTGGPPDAASLAAASHDGTDSRRAFRAGALT